MPPALVKELAPFEWMLNCTVLSSCRGHHRCSKGGRASSGWSVSDLGLLLGLVFVFFYIIS